MDNRCTRVGNAGTVWRSDGDGITYLIKCTPDLCSGVLAEWIKVVTKCSSEQHWVLSKRNVTTSHYLS